MGSYGLYQRTRDAAWQALLDFRVDKLPVSTSGIARQLGIPLLEYPDASQLLASPGLQQIARQSSGLAVRVDRRWAICYDPATVSSGRARFTIAHELGHILLGHAPTLRGDHTVVLSRVNTGDLDPRPRSPQEQAADMFAARLLAPACVLHALGAYTVEDIMRYTSLSHQAATFRAERMALLQRRGAWLLSPLERQVLAQSSAYIETNTQCR